ncbi:hypothetical protein CNR22_03420 [Sphingobacteriaceae bacterium]|nr:hypothetical protein CNR22_03420 [Sphingobacteriaceae bacterium]
MEDQDNINEHLKSRLEDFRLEPRMTSFEVIQEKMMKKKRRAFFVFVIPGIVLLLGTAGYLFFKNEKTLQMPFSNTVTKHTQREEISSTLPSSKTERSKAEIQTTNELPGKVDNTHPGPLASKSRSDKKLSPEKSKTETRAVKRSAILRKPSQEISSQRSLAGQMQGVHRKRNTDAQQSGSKNVVRESEAETRSYSTATKEINPDMVQEEPLQSLEYNFDKLELLTMPLKYERASQSIRADSARELPLTKNLNDSIKKEKKVNFFVGAAINPQMGAYFLKKEKGNDQAVYDAYYKAVKSENSLMFNYGFGLKGGFLIKNKWEVLAGFGFQKYTQKSKAVVLPFTNYNQSTSIPLTPQNFNTNNAPDPNAIYKSTYKYYDFSTEVARLYTFNRFLKVKFAIGLHAQKLRLKSKLYSADLAYSAQFDARNSYMYEQSRKWIANVNLKAGLIEEVTKNIQFQVCPNMFYSPASMIKEGFYYKQKNFGFGLECLLLFRLR